MILGDNTTGKSCLLRCISIGLCDQGSGATLMKTIGVDFLRKKNKLCIKKVANNGLFIPFVSGFFTFRSREGDIGGIDYG